MPTTDTATDIQAQIDALTKEIGEKKQALTALRHTLPAQPVTDTVFTGQDGSRHPLSSLFGDQDELILIHNMGVRCNYCMLWSDGFNGVLPHLESRAAFVVVTPDSPETQAAQAKSRDWRFKMLSHQGTSFSVEMGFHDDEGGEWPGVSTFKKQADGTIVRISKSFFGPGDDFAPIWHLFDLLPPGREWEPKKSY